MARIQKKVLGIKLLHSRQIIDTRNRIIHGYDSVSDEIIWGIITIHLTQLRIEIEKLLS